MCVYIYIYIYIHTHTHTCVIITPVKIQDAFCISEKISVPSSSQSLAEPLS